VPRFAGAVAVALAAAALAAGCGGDDSDDGGSGGNGGEAAESKGEPQVGLKELRACLKRAKVPIAGGGRLAGEGITGEIPLLAVGGGGLQDSINLLVFESPDAARQFEQNPPAAASLLTVTGRTGNVIKASSPPAAGQAAPKASEADAAIDRCVTNP
jgi:hypothetical protein